MIWDAAAIETLIQSLRERKAKGTRGKAKGGNWGRVAEFPRGHRRRIRFLDGTKIESGKDSG
jgi:hypothetical protein